MNTELVSEKEYLQEAQKHADFLNIVFGTVTFATSLTCLQFDTPCRAAIFCLLFTIPFYIYVLRIAPESLKTLRELRKEDSKNEELEKLIKKFEKTHHNFKNYQLFGISIVMYAIVLFSGDQQDINELLNVDGLKSFILWLKS